jgi:hypothetical protein
MTTTNDPAEFDAIWKEALLTPGVREALATEAEAAAPLRDALRGLVEAWDAHAANQNDDLETSWQRFRQAIDTARRALDEPIEHPVLDREVE